MTENRETFRARLEPRLAPSELATVMGAYYMAKFGHRSQVRKETDSEGAPLRYFEHPRRVALILMDEGGCYEPEMICSALFHDILEDTDTINSNILEALYGHSVARRVRLLTSDPKEGYVERLAGSDSGTVFIKLCDRLDNMRSLGDDTAFIAKQVKETETKYLRIFNQHDQIPGIRFVLGSLVDTLRDLHAKHGV